MHGSSRACCTTCTCAHRRPRGTDAANYVGNINFFDAEFHEHGGGSKLDTALGENFYSFDVTALLSGIAPSVPGASSTREMLFVKFVPGGKPETGADANGRAGGLIRQ